MGLPWTMTHFMLSCLAMPSIGRRVPKVAVRKGTKPKPERENDRESIRHN